MRFFLLLIVTGISGLLAFVLAIAAVSELTPLIAPLALLLFLYWVFTRQAANAGRTRVGAGPQSRQWFSWSNWMPAPRERPE